MLSLVFSPYNWNETVYLTIIIITNKHTHTQKKMDMKKNDNEMFEWLFGFSVSPLWLEIGHELGLSLRRIIGWDCSGRREIPLLSFCRGRLWFLWFLSLFAVRPVCIHSFVRWDCVSRSWRSQSAILRPIARRFRPSWGRRLFDSIISLSVG